jgi:hypothetical protein
MTSVVNTAASVHSAYLTYEVAALSLWDTDILLSALNGTSGQCFVYFRRLKSRKVVYENEFLSWFARIYVLACLIGSFVSEIFASKKNYL